MWYIIGAVSLLCTLTSGAPSAKEENVEDTALYQYVYRDDGFYSWYIHDTETERDVTTYWVNVTSQKWFDESFSTHPVWWHWLVVHIPVSPRFEDAGFLYISHRSNNQSPPDKGTDHVQRAFHIADTTRLITGTVFQIPNQPIRFFDDPREWNRWEDEIIAWTWRKFMLDERDTEEGGDPEIVLRMPMCKGTVKAMDAMTELVKQEIDEDITRFMIAGESKRGWTTWMTAAIDDRVVAMAPVVLSCLNMYDVFMKYYKSFNGWPYYFWDYWIENITSWMVTDEIHELTKYVDPYSYVDWMTMPTLVVSGASDEFFMLDDSHYFWEGLPGEKYHWLLDNTGHSIGSSPRVDMYWDMLATFFLSILGNDEKPVITWSRNYTETGASITLHSPGMAPREVVGYWADSVVEERRDWRTKMLNLTGAPDYIEIPTGIEWTEENVEDMGNGDYHFEVETPEEGYRAMFITVWYDGFEGRDYVFSTEAHVTPDGFPYEECETALQCRGILR